MEVTAELLAGDDVVEPDGTVVGAGSEGSQLVGDEDGVDFAGVVVEAVGYEEFGLGGDAPEDDLAGDIAGDHEVVLGV